MIARERERESRRTGEGLKDRNRKRVREIFF